MSLTRFFYYFLDKQIIIGINFQGFSGFTVYLCNVFLNFYENAINRTAYGSLDFLESPGFFSSVLSWKTV